MTGYIIGMLAIDAQRVAHEMISMRYDWYHTFTLRGSASQSCMIDVTGALRAVHQTEHQECTIINAIFFPLPNQGVF